MLEQTLSSTATRSPIRSIVHREDWKIHLTGYVLIFASFTLFALTDFYYSGNENDYFTLFILHYAIAIGYAIYLTATGGCGVRKSWRKVNLGKTAIVLNLFLISSFSLNRVVDVFDPSVTWLRVVIIITSAISLVSPLRESMTRWIKRVVDLGLGCTLVLYVYSAIAIGQGYIYGGIGLIAIGIGGHMFVPAFILTWCIFQCRRQYLTEGWNGMKWVVAGALAVTLYVAAFVTEWVIRTNHIDTLANESVLYPETELPVWVKVGQFVKHDWVSQRILKNEMVYTSPFGPGGFLRGTWQEEKRHDPLVLIGNLFAKVDLTVEDRVKVLDILNESRNSSEERLWNGSRLMTSYIVTDVDLFPEYRIAYTEKYLNIKNPSWGQQEAIYSFQLPEGSVVTSLSLWINGNEEKGILTSKGKATEAYKQIVGVEARDPSVIHWREGNTVSMRVFPCTSSEERKVKIGITSPLIAVDQKLKYQPITFEGPPVVDATEIIRVRNLGKSQINGLSHEFKRAQNGDFVREADYDPDFAFEVENVPLSIGQFSFDGYSYSIEHHAYDFAPVSKPILFLDLNKTWTKAEAEEVRTLASSFKSFVFHDNELTEVTEQNWSDIIDKEITKNFSLFPYHLLKDHKQAIVITKGDEFTPLLSDLDESKFAEGVVQFFKRGKPIKVYNLGNDISTFTATLRELRAINFAHGDVSQLRGWLMNGEFPVTREDEDHIVLHDANLVVTRRAEAGLSSEAPDHLARLFAYNRIMKKVGSSYFEKKDFREDLVNEARKAYVVSPVSSLIVLETQEDYDRFGIADDGESLLNAKKNSSGAVPEPHEWALIGACLAIMVWLISKHNQKRLFTWK